jgi:hypothetical protein
MALINLGARCALVFATLLAFAFQIQPTLAQSTPVCYPSTPYVLQRNCYQACLNQGHSGPECNKPTMLCQSCWRDFAACIVRPGQPRPIQCEKCSAAYAECMKPFGALP